jgi:hypothetical protein
MKADPRKRGRKEIAAAQTPEDRPGKARDDPGSEQRRDTGIFDGRPALDHLMKMAEWKPATRQMRVHLRNIERQ